MSDSVGDRLRVAVHSGWDAFGYVIKHQTETIQMTGKKGINLIIQYHLKHAEVEELLELTFDQNRYIYQNVLTFW